LKLKHWVEQNNITWKIVVLLSAYSFNCDNNISVTIVWYMWKTYINWGKYGVRHNDFFFDILNDTIQTYMSLIFMDFPCALHFCFLSHLLNLYSVPKFSNLHQKIYFFCFFHFYFVYLLLFPNLSNLSNHLSQFWFWILLLHQLQINKYFFY
jgi:hypothetical protein